MSRAINTITAATAADGATNLNIDSGTLFVDTTSNKVGIGTTNPVYKLDVSGQIGSQSSQAGIVFSKTNNAADNKTIQNVIDASGNMYWQALTDAGAGGGNSFGLIRSGAQINSIEAQSSGTSWFKIDNSATRVGIGTTSPISPLHVRGSSVFGTINVQSLSANAEASISFYDSADTNADKWVIGKNVGGVSADTFCFYKNGNLAVIDSSGNVGIGTPSPAYRLHVQSVAASGLNKDFVVRTGDETNFYRQSLVYNNSASTAGAFPAQSGGLYWEHGGGYGVSGGLVIATNSANAGPVILATANTERLRIDSSGNVLVGTTDSALTTGVGLKLIDSATTPVVSTVLNTSSLSNTYLVYNTNATNNGYRFYVASNGGVANFSANNANLSDERLKTNINPSGNYLDKICSIPVKTFNYKDQGEDTEKTIGVLAQEVEAHIPELINNDGFGETPADGIPLKTIYQTDLQYVLMRCIQELSAKVTALEAA